MVQLLHKVDSHRKLHEGQMSLLDLISLDDLQQLQDALADINQVSSVITDSQGNPLTLPSNEIVICNIVRQSDQGASDCTQFVATIQGTVQERRQSVCQPCKNFGIIKAAVPICIDGYHLANWWISQCCPPMPSEIKMKAYAKRIGVNFDLLMEAFESSPKGDKATFDKIIRWTDGLAHRIIKMGYQNVLLARDLEKFRDKEKRLSKQQPEVESMVGIQSKDLASDNACPQPEEPERDPVEEQITRKSRLLDAVNKIFKLALSSQEDANLPQTFLRAAQELTGSTFGLLVEQKEQGWQVAAVSQAEKSTSVDRQEDVEAITRQFDMGGIWQELVDSGGPITIPTIDDPSAWQPLPQGYPQINSLLAVPLQNNPNSSGFIALANNEQGYAATDQSDVETLARAFIEALMRRRMERTPSDTQARLHLALESTNEGLWDFNPKEETIFYSAHWFTMLGYTEDEFPQTLETWQTLSHPEDLPALEEGLKEVHTGDKDVFGVEIRMLSRAGRWCWVQVRGKCADRDAGGQATRIVGTLIDISKYKHAEVALQKANVELQRLAALDDLTQIANRRVFDDRLNQEWRRAQRDKQSMAVIFCDIDYFKKYNDSYGHVKGDDALYSVAQAISGTLKRPMDLAARYGGEEFAVVLPDTSTAGARQVCNKIREAVAALAIEHKASKANPHITLSFGVAAIVPAVDFTSKILIELADQALYQAKAMGRNSVKEAPQLPEFES